MEARFGSERQTRNLYARAWECEYEKTIFDTESNNATLSISREIPVRTVLSTEETWNTTRTAQESSRETFPQTEELCDLTNKYPDIEPDAETKLGASKQQYEQRLQFEKQSTS